MYSAAWARNRHVPWRAYLALGIGIVGISWAAIFVRWANVPGPASAFYRVLIASAVLLAWQGPQLPLRPVRRPALLALMGGVFFALDLALWNTSLMLTSAANSTLLVNTTPLWVGLGGLLLFRERLSPWFWMGTATALAGAGLILGRDLWLHPQLGAGDALALGAALFYAANLLVVQRVRTTLSAPVVMTLASIAGSLVLLIVCLALRIPLVGYSLQSWLAILGLALVSHLGGVLAINYALGHIRAALVSVTLLGQPVLVALLAAALLSEPLGLVQIAGGALVLGGIYLVNRREELSIGVSRDADDRGR